MIIKDNFRKLLTFLKFEKEEKNGKMFTDIYVKHFPNSDTFLKVDFANEQIIYPTEKGFVVNEKQTCNFSSQENAVVFECVNRLLEKGYKPEHFELEPKWKVGHGASGGRADILIRNFELKPILIIECKTFGNEFKKAWKDTQTDGGQLFSYIEQEKNVEFICLYASEFDEKANNINISQRIISHKDNPKILEQNNKLKSFKDATNVKERYNVWKNTYQLEFTEKGIFEENILAYQIGKDKYTLEIDTKPIDKLDKEGKYHEFRTKLRQYNVSRRENAFEVLVNLFLCKIVDEIENPNDLHFYWKGIAYDNYFELVDRLQKLYQIGMKKFLQEDIIYVSFEEVEKAFWPVKSKKNTVKQHVLDLFKELKFYKGLDFDFIKVHNKTQFEKNAKVLLEIIQMWQGIRLKTKSQNQFLGDMFEYFLDNGIKQTEGQFFTPVPICKYIVMSLPLENVIKNLSEPPMVIDYACGSGHFLTEYATQIVPFVEKHKNTEISEYFKNVYGIEKEDRLAKVAKVSAFMYGQENINILDRDALATNKEIPNDSFDVLVANPPFAVEDFLLTLEEDRENYELFNSNLNLGTNDIQCFFLERAKHLLAPNGVAGIIIPVTILSNTDTLTIQTREILLKYFDIVAITDLTTNYKIFGQTGTKTLVLFLRRKAQRPEPAEHFWERVNTWFETDWDNLETNTDIAFFGDYEFVKKYCEHVDIQFSEYKKLLNFSKITDFDTLSELKEFEIFKDYWTDFEKSQDFKKIDERYTKLLNGLEKTIYNEIAKLKKQEKEKVEEKEIQKEVNATLPIRKKELQEKRILELTKTYWQNVVELEKQKVYYFTLAYTNPQKVLIVKIPTDNEETKQFIGYEWSKAKGFEGISYKGGETVNDINTPMFDPKNRYNPEKINYFIQQNFLQNETKNYEIPESLQKFISYADLTDMLDFKQKNFNKTVSLTIKKNFVFETKYTLYKLDNLCEICRGASPRPIDKFITTDENGVNWIKIGDVKEGEKYITQTSQKITQDGAEKSRPVKVGDFILSNSMSFGRPYILKISGCIHDGWLLMTKFSENMNKDYLYEILSYKDVQQQFSDSASGSVVQNLNTERVKNTKIPLPPKEIQDKIVIECRAVDEEFENAKIQFQKLMIEKDEKIKSEFNNISTTMKLGEVAEFKRGPFGGSLKKEIFVNEGYKVYEQQHAINNDFSIGRYYITKEKYEEMKGFALESGDLIMSCSGTIGKVAIFPENEKEGIINQALLRFRPIKKHISSNFLKHFIQNSTELFYENSHGSGLQNIASVQILKALKIPVPTIDEQIRIVAEIEKLEQQVNEYQKTIESIPNKKQEIMKKYLI